MQTIINQSKILVDRASYNKSKEIDESRLVIIVFFMNLIGDS